MTNRVTWKQILDIEKYDLSKMRKYNVSITSFQNWISTLKRYNIETPVDINLYAIEFAMRESGRYGVMTLPKLADNPLSECRYYFLHYEPSEVTTDDNIKEMLNLLINRTKETTVLKWLNKGE